jgi:hypothetical protein
MVDEMPDKPSRSGQFQDRRAKHRSKELTNPMVVIRVSGCPQYQLKVRDLSDKGAGIVVRPDSNFLQMVTVGQEVNVRLILPREYKGPSGNFRSIVEHITEVQDAPYKGHFIIGVSFYPLGD